MTIGRQYLHKQLPRETHDEHARELFICSVSEIVTKVFSKQIRNIYLNKNKSSVCINFDELNGAKLIKLLLQNNYYQMWSSLKRTNQEMLFDAVIEVAQKNDYNKDLKRLDYGSIKQNRNIKIPKYISKIDIHCMPGGYVFEDSKNDLFAGKLYDRSLFLYAKGGLGNKNNEIGEATCEWIKKNLKKFNPNNILDMGCSIGSNTIPYCEHFPKAKINAVDLSGGMLRYAYLRSNEFKKNIHFSQQNAEYTNFNDNSFDLIVSHLLTHETSFKAYSNIINESYRLLKSKGIMIHVETDWFTKNNSFNKSLLEWETHYNAEPFKSTLDNIDQIQLLNKAGFDKKNIYQAKINSSKKGTKYFKGQWIGLVAKK
ncbi:class I SAM-dependent methyltransferase [Alphaproteobacteria bacterium]|nr:class I SAM-dependent methyltransferase [Alphaproteobacteria bacterium]